jgi:hypothetical protein
MTVLWERRLREAVIISAMLWHEWRVCQSRNIHRDLARLEVRPRIWDMGGSKSHRGEVKRKLCSTRRSEMTLRKHGRHEDSLAGSSL